MLERVDSRVKRFLVVRVVVVGAAAPSIRLGAKRATRVQRLPLALAESLGECRSMIRASADAGKRLMVGESYFFSGPHVLARKLIAPVHA